MRLIVISVLLLGVTGAASAQSFDCKKATTRIEKMVCADPKLSELDEYLGRYYSVARMELGSAASCLQADQAQWLKSTRETCRDAACLTTVYLNRLGELDAFQPGATAIKNIALPNVPALVWVIAPAADKTVAPPKAGAGPLEVFGDVVDDLTGGDGFVIRKRDGTKVPLVLAMFLEPIDHQHLTALAAEKGVSFRARGYAASDGARAYFEPSRCTFVHRISSAPH